MRDALFKIIIIITCFEIFVSCRKETREVQFIEEMDRSVVSSTIEEQLNTLNQANPIDDANVAFIHGDMRFVGILEDPPDVPVSSEDAFSIEARKTYGFKLMWGTSEHPKSGSHQELQRVARIYAIKYNDALLNLLRTKKGNSSNHR